jgi:hypothetical protein
MPEISYWLDLFSHKTWSEFLQAGGTVSGFRESRWKTAQRINPGDYFLCYLTGVSRWIGLLEVTGRAYRDESPVWEDDPFPVRFSVKVLIALRPEIAIPIIEMRDRLSIFTDLTNPHAWTGRLRGSPARWTKSDGLAVVAALEQAQADPVERPLDHRKLERRSPFFRSSDDSFVSIPDDEVDARTPAQVADEARPTQAEEISAHLEIQWLLAKLGNDMGLKIWVARNDRNRSCKGHTFTSLPNLVTELPVQFDDATRRTIELIDVLWLKGQAVVAAFEIESTTSIYSGLLRMSDLISMQPNLAMPLYIVAPDERRDKVKEEILRPTFSKLPKPLSDLCRYVSFSALRSNVEKSNHTQGTWTPLSTAFSRGR